MKLHVLRYFLAVAEELNISKASELLYVTQPTLSRQIMELEDELKVKLFERGRRRLVLTEKGALLRKRAEEIFELVEKTEQEIKASDKVISGEIYIGGGETDGIRIIAKTVRDLQKDFPLIKINLHSGNADDVTERLDKGLLDFGILVGSANLAKYDVINLPSSDSWGVLMRKDMSLASHKTIRPKDLLNIPIIISNQSLVAEQISKWCRYDYSKLNIVGTYNLVYNAARMVEEGLGYAIILDKLVNSNGSNMKFTCFEPKLEVGLQLVWKKYKVFSKQAKVFLERLEEVIN